MKKFMKHGNFNTLKTAQNTWGKIKAKLVAAAGDKDEDDAGEGAENENGPGTSLLLHHIHSLIMLYFRYSQDSQDPCYDYSSFEEAWEEGRRRCRG